MLNAPFRSYAKGRIASCHVMQGLCVELANYLDQKQIRGGFLECLSESPAISVSASSASSCLARDSHFSNHLFLKSARPPLPEMPVGCVGCPRQVLQSEHLQSEVLRRLEWFPY